jgi:hypothetical protein
MKAKTLDNPNWNQTMNGLESKGYWESMELNLETLLGKNAWTKVYQRSDMNVLSSTWIFNCNQFPERGVQNLKAQLFIFLTLECPRGCMANHMLQY